MALFGGSTGGERPVTFADLGINVPQRTHQTFFGKIRTPQTFSALEWVFIALASLAIVATMVFAVYRLATLSKSEDDNILAVLVILNLGFSMFYLIHGILQEQPYEIAVLLMTIGILIVYVILNFFDNSVNDNLKLARLIATSVVGPIVICVGVPLAVHYFNSGNLIFRTVGGDSRYNVMCRTLFLSYTLMTFDSQALISSLVLVKDGGFDSLTTVELVVLVVGTLFTITWLLLGYASVRLENKTLTWIFLALCTFHPGYAIWKFAMLPRKRSLLFSCTIAACVLLLVIHFLLICIMVKVYRNYGQGLKEKVYGSSAEQLQRRPRYGSTENIATAGDSQASTQVCEVSNGTQVSEGTRDPE